MSISNVAYQPQCLFGHYIPVPLVENHDLACVE